MIKSWAEILNKILLVHDERKLGEVLHKLGPKGERIRPVRVAFVNAHALNLSMDDPAFMEDLTSCDFIFRDGSGIKILYKLLGCDPGLNLNGTDLIPLILKLYAGYSAALLGTQEPYLDRAAEIIQDNGVFPVCLLDGFQEDRAYLEVIQRDRPTLVILAMGMPKQERVANLLARNLDYPCLIVCGGAILDFLGGKVSRAPLIYRRFGMEWLYRLMQEPRRLFRRYVIGNFVFLARSFWLALPPHRPQIKTSSV